MNELSRLDGCDLPFSRAPIFHRVLTGGRSNQNLLIEADGELWVLRLSTPNVSEFGIDRYAEELALSQAATSGIAPRIAFASRSNGILITEHIDGRHWAPGALSENTKLEQLVALVERVHQLEINIPITDYYQHAENYWTQLANSGDEIPASLKLMRETINRGLCEDPSPKLAARLCHRDISPSNVIEKDGRLFLLDWEYAARGTATFDFASIQFEWSVSADRLADVAGLSLEHLKFAYDLYRYTCQLWEQLNNRFRR